MAYPRTERSIAIASILSLLSLASAVLYGALDLETGFISHYRVASIAIAHGCIALATGLILLIGRRISLRPALARYLRLVHLVFGVLAGAYGLLAYLSPP